MMKRLTGEGCKPKPTPEQHGLTEGVQALLIGHSVSLQVQFGPVSGSRTMSVPMLVIVAMIPPRRILARITFSVSP